MEGAIPTLGAAVVAKETTQEHEPSSGSKTPPTATDETATDETSTPTNIASPPNTTAEPVLEAGSTHAQQITPAASHAHGANPKLEFPAPADLYESPDLVCWKDDLFRTCLV